MLLNGSSKLTKREVTALEDSYLSYEGALGSTGLLYDLDELLLTRGNGQGLKLYDKLLDDPHIYAVMRKLAGAVTSREWDVVPGSDKRLEKKAAEIVREQILSLNTKDLNITEENHSSINGFDALTTAFVMGGVLNGRHFGEVMWGIEGDRTVALEIRSRDPRQFAFAKGNYGYVLRHMNKENSMTGVEVPLKKILAWSHGGLDGNPYGRALGRVLFWPNFFKKNGIRFWLKFVERFASPKPMGKYPRGATPTQIAELRMALAAFANETEIAIPEGMLIEYLEAAQSGTIDTYESLCKFMDAQISQAVLGETGSTDQTGSGGSRARDQVGNEVRLEISKAVSDSLSSTFNRLAVWITDYNLPGAIAPKIWRNFDNKEDLDSRVNRDKVLFDLGYRIDAQTVTSVYGEGYEQASGEAEKPALISSLGVGGVQALTGLLTQAATGQLPKENAIAVLVSVFGIDEAAAGKMVPDAPPEKPAQKNPLDQLFGGQDGGNTNGNVSGGTDGGNNSVGAGAAFSEDEGDRAVFAKPSQDIADRIAEKARPLIEDAIAPWLTTITNFVEQATSLEEIRDGLIDLYPELDDAAFAEAMGHAIGLADLAGREEVLGDDADVAFAEAIEAALNGTLEFAAKATGKKPNCNPAKSHFCQTANGRGSCVPLSKKCKFKPTGAVQAAADYVAKAPKAEAIDRSSVGNDSVRRSFARVSSENKVQAAEKRMKEILASDETNIYVRANADAVELIIKDRFKSQFETNTSNAFLNLDKRSAVEEKKFNYDKKTLPEDRPIYGYLEKDGHWDDDSRVSMYGKVVIKLKPDVKKKSTFTSEDSFTPDLQASSILNPSIASVRRSTAYSEEVTKEIKRAKNITDLKKAMGTTSRGYAEAQMHGKLLNTDIAELIYTDGSKPSAETLKWAKEFGVKIVKIAKKRKVKNVSG
jgi:phage gp29-like protein